MAKRNALALRSAPQVIMMAPRRARRGIGRALQRARGPRKAQRAARAVGGALWQQKTTIASVAGAGIVGYLDAAGHLDFIPDLVPGMGDNRLPTIAIATYLAGHVAKSPKLKHAGVGLACAAAFGYGVDKGREAKSKKP